MVEDSQMCFVRTQDAKSISFSSLTKCQDFRQGRDNRCNLSVLEKDLSLYCTEKPLPRRQKAVSAGRASSCEEGQETSQAGLAQGRAEPTSASLNVIIHKHEIQLSTFPSSQETRLSGLLLT